MYKKIISILLSVLMCLQLTSCKIDENTIMDNVLNLSEIIKNEDINNFEKIDIEKVGFSTKGKKLLSKDEQKQYDILDEHIYRLKSNIEIESLNTDNIKTIIEYYRADNPQVFWLTNHYEYDYNKFSNEILNFDISYDYLDRQLDKTIVYTPDLIEKMNAEIEEKTKIILSGIDHSMSDYDIVKYIHDYLAKNTRYDESGSFQHNIYGALVEERAVCDGYAFAMVYLLSLVGIDSQIVFGSSLDGQTHAWNIVNIEGEYYHVDVTWDLPPSGTDQIIYFNFMVSEESILKNHEIKSPKVGEKSPDYPYYVPIPEATNENYNYYMYNELYISSFDAQNINMFLNKLQDANNKKLDTIQFVFKDENVLQEYIDAMQNLDYRFKGRFPYSNKEIISNCSIYIDVSMLLFSFEYID